MHLDAAGAEELARDVTEIVKDTDGVHVAVCPPFVHLSALSKLVKGNGSRLRLGGQNMHFAEQGAYTGEVSASMLVSVGCHYVILGHSERRQYFGETNVDVNRKVRQALKTGLVPIICVGELLREREEGRAFAVIAEQVKFAVAEVELLSPDSLVIAYEPVWAIGTGRTATPDMAQEMHGFIRRLLAKQFGEDTTKGIHILYGGSMKPGNAHDLLSQSDIDGGLIGGASLKAEDFGAILEAARAI